MSAYVASPRPAPVTAALVFALAAWLFFLLPIGGTVFLAFPLAGVAFILGLVCCVRSAVPAGLMVIASACLSATVGWAVGLLCLPLFWLLVVLPLQLLGLLAVPVAIAAATLALLLWCVKTPFVAGIIITVLLLLLLL